MGLQEQVGLQDGSQVDVFQENDGDKLQNRREQPLEQKVGWKEWRG